MHEESNRFEQIFLEVFESLPRQGPGSRECAIRALALCHDLPTTPKVLDLGCGVGGQTLYLAELTSGSIVAIDRHAPSIQRLQATILKLGLTDRVQPLVGDMAAPALAAASFDLIWSEGAFYNIGIENALKVCRSLLKPGGYLAFTDAVWCVNEPPTEAKAMFEPEYPDMGSVQDVIAKIAASQFSLVDHFALPSEAWWQDFYTPMEARINEMRSRYQGDPEALAVLDEVAQEPERHRRLSDFYGYEFFVVRLMDAGS